MNNEQLKALEKLDIALEKDTIEIFENYMRIFLEKNSYINLISKNDEKFLFEKHVFDSLAINLFLEKKQNEINNSQFSLLDIGTGGGFPSIPIAILNSNLKVYPIDSIRKKIKIIEEIKDELGLKNIFPICERVENISEKYDYITTRAVAPLKVILKYAIPHLEKDGYFVAYKAKNASEEIEEAKKVIKKQGIKLIKTIEYTLPLEEVYNRNLLVFKFN